MRKRNVPSATRFLPGSPAADVYRPASGRGVGHHGGGHHTPLPGKCQDGEDTEQGSWSGGGWRGRWQPG